jgi:hypothetical protein
VPGRGDGQGRGDRRLIEVLAVLATTTIRDLPTEVRLGPEDEMPRERVLNLDHVDTVNKGFLDERITTLSAERLCAVCRALDVASRVRMSPTCRPAGNSNRTLPGLGTTGHSCPNRRISACISAHIRRNIARSCGQQCSVFTCKLAV